MIELPGFRCALFKKRLMGNRGILQIGVVEVGETFSIIDAWPRVRLALFFFVSISRGRISVVGLLELDLASVTIHLKVRSGQQTRQFRRKQALLYFKCHYKYFINEQTIPPSSLLLLLL